MVLLKTNKQTKPKSNWIKTTEIKMPSWDDLTWQGHLWSQGQGHKVVIIDVMWKSLTYGICIPDMNTESCINHKLHAKFKFQSDTC